MTDLVPTPQPRLSIAVVGVGNIGSTFAYRLAHAGHDVTAVARPGSPRLQQLRRDGGVVLTTGDRAEVRVADAVDEQADYDLVVVTLLAHQVDAVLPALQRSRARCVQFMFVTFDPERLRDAVGVDRCSFGMPFVMAMLDGDGKLKATIGRQKTLHGDPRWVAVFAAAGLPSALEPDMPLWLRCHVPLTVAFEGIAVAAQRRGGGASWAQAMAAARGVRGGLAIVQGLGYRLYPRSKAVIGSLPLPGIALPLWLVSRVPSFRDLLATGLPECQALVDALTAAAAGARPAVPAAVEAVRAVRPTADPSASARQPNA